MTRREPLGPRAIESAEPKPASSINSFDYVSSSSSKRQSTRCQQIVNVTENQVRYQQDTYLYLSVQHARLRQTARHPCASLMFLSTEASTGQRDSGGVRREGAADGGGRRGARDVRGLQVAAERRGAAERDAEVARHAHGQQCGEKIKFADEKAFLEQAVVEEQLFWSVGGALRRAVRPNTHGLPSLPRPEPATLKSGSERSVHRVPHRGAPQTSRAGSGGVGAGTTTRIPRRGQVLLLRRWARPGVGWSRKCPSCAFRSRASGQWRGRCCTRHGVREGRRFADPGTPWQGGVAGRGSRCHAGGYQAA